MKYAVRWIEAAHRQIVRIWAEANDAPRVREAYDAITRQLEDAPEDQGESREPDIRIDHKYPLGYRFHIDSVNKNVHVIEVWRYL